MHEHTCTVQFSSERISSGTTEPYTSLEGRKSASHMASAQAIPPDINKWTARQVVMHTVHTQSHLENS